MDDTSDGGRANISRLASGSSSVEHIPFDADYALLFNRNFSFLADLEGAGNQHGVVAHDASGLNGSTPEFGITYASLGMSAGDTVQFTVYLISDTGFLSNEGIPGTGQASNPGFNDSTTINMDDYNEFTTVPEPSTLGFAALGLLALGRQLRRRRA